MDELPEDEVEATTEMGGSNGTWARTDGRDSDIGTEIGLEGIDPCACVELFPTPLTCFKILLRALVS